MDVVNVSKIEYIYCYFTKNALYGFLVNYETLEKKPIQYA